MQKGHSGGAPCGGRLLTSRWPESRHRETKTERESPGGRCSLPGHTCSDLPFLSKPHLPATFSDPASPPSSLFCPSLTSQQHPQLLNSLVEASRTSTVLCDPITLQRPRFPLNTCKFRGTNLDLNHNMACRSLFLSSGLSVKKPHTNNSLK